MIGVVLHLAALVPAAVAARVTRAALGLLCRAPQGSEVEQLAAECDVLRGERDTARLQVTVLRAQLLDETLRADAWAHEANEAQAAATCAEGSVADALAECGALQTDLVTAQLEYAAAGDVVKELRGMLTTARAERAEALRENEKLVEAARAVVRSLGSPFGDPPALASPWVDRSYVQAWRALVALVEAPAAVEAPRG